MHFGNSAGSFGGSAVRRPVGHDSAAAMSRFVALLPNYMQIVQKLVGKKCVEKEELSMHLNRKSTYDCMPSALCMVCRGALSVPHRHGMS